MLGNTTGKRKGQSNLSSSAACLLATLVAVASCPASSAETTVSSPATGLDAVNQNTLDKRTAGGADTEAGARSQEATATGAQATVPGTQQTANPPARQSGQPAASTAPSSPPPQVNSAPASQPPVQPERTAPEASPNTTSTPEQPPAEAAPQARAPRVIWKPGFELSAGTDADDLVPTDDVELARKQVAAYPDNPEAGFILAVALTRTSRVEEALQEVRRARKLAEAKGGPAYFDKMIASYEEMVKHHPKENRARYGLAWAYYMKAFMISKASR